MSDTHEAENGTGTPHFRHSAQRIRWEVLLRLLKYRCLSTGLIFAASFSRIGFLLCAFAPSRESVPISLGTSRKAANSRSPCRRANASIRRTSSRRAFRLFHKPNFPNWLHRYSTVCAADDLLKRFDFGRKFDGSKTASIQMTNLSVEIWVGRQSQRRVAAYWVFWVVYPEREKRASP